MITPEKMYEVLFDNKEYVYFIISNHFKKAEPNEKTYKTMLKNNIYFKYLSYLNPSLKKQRQSIIMLLNNFKNKFWLKKDSFSFLLMLKEIKNNNLSLQSALTIMPDYKLYNGFYEYLELINNQTKISTKKLYAVAMLYEESGIEAVIKFLIKHNLVK